MGSILFLLIVIILVLWILASCIRIVPQAYAIVLERLGAYQATWGTGLHFKIPIFDRTLQTSICRACGKKSQSERAGCRFPTTAGYHKR